MTERSGGPLLQPVVAGAVAAVAAYASSFAVVLAALRAVGADAAQATSGLFAVSVAMGAGSILFPLLMKVPVTLAWSTPGAALLAVAAAPRGGFPAAVGAFLITGVLLLATGLLPGVAAVVRRVPASVAGAMLAGVLLALCVQPFRLLAADPLAIGGMLVAWAVLLRVAPRWAVLGALAVGIAAFLAAGSGSAVRLSSGVVPLPQAVAPAFSVEAALSIAVPLYLVTMTSQNLPGAAVMRGLGWEVPWRPALAFTGAASALTAPFGGFTINLSAIAAALVAGPDAGPARERRWIASLTTGVVYLLLGLCAPLVVAVARAAPAGLVAAFAGIALLGALAGAVGQAVAVEEDRLAAVAAFAVAASGLTVLGIGAAFWALVAGCVLLPLVRAGQRRAAPPLRAAP